MFHCLVDTRQVYKQAVGKRICWTIQLYFLLKISQWFCACLRLCRQANVESNTSSPFTSCAFIQDSLKNIIAFKISHSLGWPWFCYVAKDDLNFLILWHPPVKYRYAPSHLLFAVLWFKLRTLWRLGWDSTNWATPLSHGFLHLQASSPSCTKWWWWCWPHSVVVRFCLI